MAYSLPVFETTRAMDMERGTLSFTIPIDAMTTFKAPSSGFGWYLCCRGEITGRPDLADDFPVTVLPGGGAA